MYMNLVNFEYDFAESFHIKLAKVQCHSVIKLQRKITYGHIDHPTLNHNYHIKIRVCQKFFFFNFSH